MAGFGEIGGFDANKVEPSGIIQAGEYDAVITSSEWKATKDGGGKYLYLELQILSGPAQNRKLFDRLNLVNANATAVQIAKGTLSAICRAVGVMTPNDSSELHNRPLRVTVTVREAQGEYGPQNEIKAYKPRHAGPAPTATAAAPAAPTTVGPNAEPTPF
jgi:hypothetical protein